MPPGKPFQGYNPHGVSVDMSPGWQVASYFGPGSRLEMTIFTEPSGS